MRSIVLIIITLVVVVGAFAGYVLLQSPTAKHVDGNLEPLKVTPPAPIDSSQQQLGAGEGVWTKSYDSKTGNLSNEFRAKSYNPRQDGTVDMVEPEGYFYLGGGQKLYIHGVTGNVVDPNATGGKVQGQSQTPDRGKLQDVTLKLYHNINDAQPQFTCRMNNLAFDNDTFRIATEDCQLPDANGKLVRVSGDRVPVDVIGVDYDFHGFGLLIKWNERDRRLARLEIEHGDYLVVKHPSALNLTAPTAPASQPVARALRDERGPIALASADPQAGAEALPPPPPPPLTPTTKPRRKRKPTSKPAPPPTSAPVIHRVKDPGVYRAQFNDNIQITQAGLSLATADQMNVDFLINSTDPASTQPATQSTTNPATQAIASQPATRRTVAHSKPDRASARRPASAPATQPADPIIVKWTGKLIVAPPTPDVPPVEADDSVLELIGDARPAILNREGSVIHCAKFRYHTLDQSVEVDHSAAYPEVMLHDANGSNISAPSLKFNGSQDTADIPGPATALFPVETAAGKTSATQPAQFAKVDWADNCHLTFTHNGEGPEAGTSDAKGGEKNDRVIDKARLEGDVHVDHPQVNLQSDTLDLAFDNLPKAAGVPAANPSTAGTSAQLRSMLAQGNVDCILTDSQNKRQHITSDELSVNTVRGPRGNDVPSEIISNGDVDAFDETQELNAGYLIAHLEPAADGEAHAATRPTSAGGFGGDAQLKDMHAEQDVHFKTNDGAFADADQLDIQSVKDAAAQSVQVINLTGNARAGDRLNTITGPLITYNPAIKQAHVVGPGTMHTIQQQPSRSATQQAASTQPAPRPMDIAWHGKFDLVDNLITITDHVSAKTVSGDGTTNNATGDKIVLDLIDAPATTQPSTQQSAVASVTTSTTQPAGFSHVTDTNFMKNKVVDTITLTALADQNVELNSILLDPAGGILRAMNLLSSKVVYDKTNERFIVPTAGRLLVRDNRAQAKTSATQPTASVGGMHGNTAFEWKKDLTYDEKIDEAVMTGKVHIVHEAPDATAYEIFTDRVVADIEPVPRGTAKTTDEQSFRVKKLKAIGLVRVLSPRVNFDGAECVFDPMTQILTAHSNAREPAHVLDATGVSTGSFDELMYNTQTGDVKMKEFHAFVRKH